MYENGTMIVLQEKELIFQRYALKYLQMELYNVQSLLQDNAALKECGAIVG